MTLTEAIGRMFGGSGAGVKSASSPAQRAVSAGSPGAATPTDAQAQAGNYRKVHLSLDGFRISIENPKGSVRSGTDGSGRRWSNTVRFDYGDIRGTEGPDGDPVDIFLSDHPEKGAVFVVDQIDPKTGRFDEHKVMYGFDSIGEAKDAYLSCYEPGWKGLGWITPVTKAEFRKWIDSSTRKTKPFHEYSSVSPIVDPIKVKAAEAANDGHARLLPGEADKLPRAKDDDPMEGVPAGVKLRSFIDAPATRTAIMDNVLEAVRNRFPVEDDDVRLELRDVRYEGPTSYTLEQQKSALLGNRRLGCGISGTWRLTDRRTGKVLDERRDGVMRVPYYTDRGTIINNGSEYTVISQARLSPGVYARRKQNGELEAQFNVANGFGFRIGLNRETGALNMSVGQAHIPLYPVLRALGVSDSEIRKSWGDRVADVNLGMMDPRAIDKLYARYAGRRADMSLPPKDKAAFVSDAMRGSRLDPDVMARTLGMENADGVTGAVMLRAAQKLLNVNRGEEEPDERDNPRFSRFYGVEDMLRERIDRDAGRLSRSILSRVRRDRSLSRIGRNALSPYLDTFLSGSGLAMPGEEANPMSILTQQSRITRLGEGGISSPDLVTPEARNVQGDYLGYVDFISGPESFGIGIDVRAALGTMKGSDHRLYNRMVDMRTGRTRYVALDDAASHTVAFPGQDPQSPRLYAMRKGVPTMVPRDEVDYMVPGFGNTVSAGINMTPMPTAVQAGRQFYMSKFWEQYLPQKDGEVPLVDSLMDDGKTTYSEFYGRKAGCLTAPFAGTVVKAGDSEIVVRGKDGQTHTASLVKGLPFNRMSSISYTPQVRKGDEVEEGGLLANSNFTDPKTGAFNMGHNLKVAVLPAPAGASSYEDAIVISESAAKKMATSRTYGFERDAKDGVQISRGRYLAAFPQAYTKAQADTIGDDGVVKVGTVLHRDDPVMLAIGPKMLSAEDAQLGRLSGVLRNALTDKSQKWEHDWPGVVTDVVSGPHGAKVYVRSEPPVKVGDKLCYDEETEVLTTRGWLRFRDVTLDDRVATLDPDTYAFDYIHPVKVMSYDHDGPMYRVREAGIDLLVTPNHNMFVRPRGRERFSLIPAEDIAGKRVGYMKGGEWIGSEVEWIDFPPHISHGADGAHAVPGGGMGMDTFLMLLGMYLSAGMPFEGHGVHGLAISQPRRGAYRACEAIFRSEGIPARVVGDRFIVIGKPIYDYFSSLGGPSDRRIPGFVFGLSARQQEIFLRWLLAAAGLRHSGRGTLDTASRGLADDLQRVCLHTGRTSSMFRSGLPEPGRGAWSVRIMETGLMPTVGGGRRREGSEEGFVTYSGKVYCCTVPKWHVIFVRRNGEVCWCGNSPENGLKGIVGAILSDDKMPRDAATNEPYDMLMNPMGFLSRVAPAQIMLMNLAKVAKKTGRQIRIPQTPPPEGWQAWVERQMADAGVKESADVFDPQTGRTIRNVGDGYAYVKAFHHLAEKKFSARGVDGAYTQDEQPAKGGEDGAKRLSGFDALAILSHGATDVLKDSITVRGGMNEDYWRRYRLGLPVQEPGVPFVYRKFLDTLRAGGVNVVEKGDVTSIMPQTDSDIDGMAQGRMIESAQMVDSDMKPVKGGLFDLGATGGMGGSRWSMILLPEPLPNPIMEEPVRRVLGLTAKRMEAILSGREELDGKTGGEALKSALSKLDVDDAIERARTEARYGRGSRRDNAVKVLGCLKSAREMGMRPDEWMISRVPVLPPMFRPVAKMGDVALVPDMNELYRELIEMKRNYEDLSRELPASALSGERLAMYGAVKAAYGLGDPITAEGRAKNLKGAIRQIIGEIPKCYDSETELLTQRGWVKFGDVVEGDIAATVNPATMKLEWQRPSEVIHSRYNGIMVHTKSGKIDLLVTPNHSHFIRSRIGSLNMDFSKGRSKWSEWRKVEAASLRYRGSRFHMLTAPAGYDGSGEPVFPGVTDKMAFAFLCGMYVAEGWDTRYSVNICQSSVNGEICQIIREKFAASGVKHTETTFKKKNGRLLTYWSIFSKEAADWFRGNFGHLAGGKFISKVVLEWKTEYLRQFLDGYLYGDGEKLHGRMDPYTNKTFYNKDIMTCRHSRASTTSVRLVDCLAELCMKIGLGFRVLDVIRRDNPKWNVQYRFRIDGWNKVVLEGDKFHSWEHYDGYVHCVTVPNGLLVVRREGCTAVSGNSGMFQSKVISKTQDLVGRSVIAPNRNYDMDQIGIPEEMAWEIFRPFVERKLTQRGYAPVDVRKMMDERDPTARHILEDVMAERPVLMDRAPTWHKFNIMAFRPHLTKGRAISVSPLVCSGFNADFDGDLQIGSVRICLKNKALDDFNKSGDIGCINLRTLVHYWAARKGRSCPDAD